MQGSAQRTAPLCDQQIGEVIKTTCPHATVTAADADLVVLSDNLVADPRMLRDLHSQGVAHLAVRVRDGTGLVGPLVVPGVTSCLNNH